MHFVKELVNYIKNMTLTAMIKEFFSPDDASAILSIPLSTRLPADRMIWAYSPNENLMVKSAYRLAAALDLPGVHPMCQIK